MPILIRNIGMCNCNSSVLLTASKSHLHLCQRPSHDHYSVCTQVVHICSQTDTSVGSDHHSSFTHGQGGSGENGVSTAVLDSSDTQLKHEGHRLTATLSLRYSNHAHCEFFYTFEPCGLLCLCCHAHCAPCLPATAMMEGSYIYLVTRIIIIIIMVIFKCYFSGELIALIE